MKIICVMAIHRRPEITIETIRLLQKQTLPIHKIVLIGDSKIERNVAKVTNCCYCETKNDPLSKKWQFGVNFSKQFNPDAILINGSDSWLSLNWCEFLSKFITEYEYEVVGTNFWYDCYVEPRKKIELSYLKYTNKRQDYTIGAGRLISKGALDRCGWLIYPKDKNRCLDGMCEKILRENKEKILSIYCDYAFHVGVKSILWSSINQWYKNKKIEIKKVEKKNKKTDSTKTKTITTVPFTTLDPFEDRFVFTKEIDNIRGWFLSRFPEAYESINKLVPEIIW